MSRFSYAIPVSVLSIDADGNVVDETSFPSKDRTDALVAAATESWKASNFPAAVAGPLKGHVAKSWMGSSVDALGRLELIVTVEMEPGFRLTAHRRELLVDELDAQMSDGWGECFFGEWHVFVDADGNRFAPEVDVSPSSLI